VDFIGSKDYWDEKYTNRSDSPLNPEVSLVENISCFKIGSVLDIACGDGRNALFLLENKFKVLGVDYSGIALNRLKLFAEKNHYLVDTKQIDLSIANALEDIGIFDNILINHYKLSAEQLADIKNHISDDGVLFICGFGYKHVVDSKIKKEDLIQTADFVEVEKAFELIKYAESQDDRGFFVTYIFRKKKS